jgi:outer membrane protein W
MKKLFTTLVIVSLVIQTVSAQKKSETSINKGNYTATFYFGAPDFLALSLKSAYELNNREKDQLSIKGSIPIGIHVSYFINDNLAIGGEISYESAQMKWRENEPFLGSDSTHVLISHNYLLNASRIRFLVILNYHFAIKKNSDWYVGFGLGYSHNPIRLITDAPDPVNVSSCFFPITAKTKVGFNYYLAKNIAINAEAGIGGPLLSIGMTIKF